MATTTELYNPATAQTRAAAFGAALGTPYAGGTFTGTPLPKRTQTVAEGSTWRFSDEGTTFRAVTADGTAASTIFVSQPDRNGNQELIFAIQNKTAAPPERPGTAAVKYTINADGNLRNGGQGAIIDGVEWNPTRFANSTDPAVVAVRTQVERLSDLAAQAGIIPQRIGGPAARPALGLAPL